MDVMTAAWNVAEDYDPGQGAPRGASGLAKAIGENPNTFAHALKGTGGAALHLRTAVKMTKRTGDLRILHAFAAECGQMCVPLPEGLELEGSDCMKALAETAKEFNDLVQAVCGSLSDDGRISENDLRKIDREGGEAVAKLQQLLNTARAFHLSTRPPFGS